MRIRKRASGSAATPAVLSLLLVILVGVTVYVFASGAYAPPPAITDVGHAIDHQYDLTLAVVAVVFILSQLGLAFAIFRFRDHGQKAHFTRGNNTMEVIWTTATDRFCFVGLGLMGRKAWAECALRKRRQTRFRWK